MSEAKENLINQFPYGAPCAEGDYQPDYPQAFDSGEGRKGTVPTNLVENQGAAETADAAA